MAWEAPMTVELRWVVPEGTTTAAPRLQYRNWGEWPAAPDPWQDVPTVVVPQEPPKPAPTALIATGVEVQPVVYTDEPEQDALLAKFAAAGFKYDGFGYWQAELTTSDLLTLARAFGVPMDGGNDGK